MTGVGDRFPSVYSIAISGDVTLDDITSSGVVEPGSHVRMHYTVRNGGGMPTPRDQDIVMSFSETLWITRYPYDSQAVAAGWYAASALPRSLPQSTSVPLPQQIHGLIAEVRAPAVGKAFSREMQVPHSAVVTRVNRQMPLQPSSHQISHALSTSEVFGEVCTTAGGELFVLSRIYNHSRLPIGFNAPIPRAATAQHLISDCSNAARDDTIGQAIEIAGPVPNATFLGPSAASIRVVRINNMPVQVDDPKDAIDMINPGETRTVVYSIRLDGFKSDEEAARNTMNHGIAQTVLDLGNPSSGGQRPIQIQPFQIQMAEPFQYVQNETRGLIVCNNRTTRPELGAWKEIFSQYLGGKFPAVWNTSLYGGFSLRHKTTVNIDGASVTKELGEIFEGSSSPIVILNNSCSPLGIRTSVLNPYHPMEFVKSDELFDATKKLGCRMFIVGPRKGLRLNARLLKPLSASIPREFADIDLLLKAVESDLGSGTTESAAIIQATPDRGSSSSAVSSKSSHGYPAFALADKKGFLLKKKQRGKGHEKRFFALRGTVLSYYKSDTEKAPSGSFDLTKCSLMEQSEESPAKGASSSAIHIKSPEQLLVLQASVPKGATANSSAPELEAWKIALQAAMTFGASATTSAGDGSTPEPTTRRVEKSAGPPQKYYSTQVIARTTGESKLQEEVRQLLFLFG